MAGEDKISQLYQVLKSDENYSDVIPDEKKFRETLSDSSKASQFFSTLHDDENYKEVIPKDFNQFSEKLNLNFSKQKPDTSLSEQSLQSVPESAPQKTSDLPNQFQTEQQRFSQKERAYGPATNIENVLAKNVTDKVLPYLEKRINANPEDEDALYQMGRAKLLQKDYNSALDIFTNLTAKNPKQPAYLQGLANAQYYAGQQKEGLQTQKEAQNNTGVAEPDPSLSGAINPPQQQQDAQGFPISNDNSGVAFETPESQRLKDIGGATQLIASPFTGGVQGINEGFNTLEKSGEEFEKGNFKQGFIKGLQGAVQTVIGTAMGSSAGGLLFNSATALAEISGVPTEKFLAPVSSLLNKDASENERAAASFMDLAIVGLALHKIGKPFSELKDVLSSDSEKLKTAIDEAKQSSPDEQQAALQHLENPEGAKIDVKSIAIDKDLQNPAISPDAKIILGAEKQKTDDALAKQTQEFSEKALKDAEKQDFISKLENDISNATSEQGKKLLTDQLNKLKSEDAQDKTGGEPGQPSESKSEPSVNPKKTEQDGRDRQTEISKAFKKEGYEIESDFGGGDGDVLVSKNGQAVERTELPKNLVELADEYSGIDTDIADAKSGNVSGTVGGRDFEKGVQEANKIATDAGYDHAKHLLNDAKKQGIVDKEGNPYERVQDIPKEQIEELKNNRKLASDESKGSSGTKEKSDSKNRSGDKTSKAKVRRRGVPKARRKIRDPRYLSALKIDSTSPYDHVLQHFISGGEINRSAIQELFGVKGRTKNLKGEYNSRFGILGKDAPGIQKLAHELYEQHAPEEDSQAFESKQSPQEYREAIESVLSDFTGRKAMVDDLLNRHNDTTEDYYSQDFGDMESDIIQQAESVFENMSDEEFQRIADDQESPEQLEALVNSYLEQERSAEKDVPERLYDFEKFPKEVQKVVTDYQDGLINEDQFHEELGKLGWTTNTDMDLGDLGGYIEKINPEDAAKFKGKLNEEKPVEKTVGEVKAQKEYDEGLSKLESDITDTKKERQNKLDGINKKVDLFGGEGKKDVLFDETQDQSPERIKEVLKPYDDKISKLEKERQDFIDNKDQFLKKYEGQQEIPSAAEEPKPDSFKKLADLIRKGKISDDVAMATVPFAKDVWNGALEVLAKAVEAGGEFTDAVKEAIDHIKSTDWYKNLSKADKTAAEQKFNEHAETLKPSPEKVLADKIEKVVSKKQTLKEKVKAAGDEIKKLKIKDPIKRRVAALKASAQAIWDAYVNEPKWTDFKKAIGEYSFEKQKNDKEVMDLIDAAKKKVPNALRREAISNWIEAAGNEELLKKRAADSPAKFKRGYEDALNLTDGEKEIARSIQEYMDDKFKQGFDNGILQTQLKDYFTHIGVKEDNPLIGKLNSDFASGKINTSFKYAKGRIFETFHDLEKAGYRASTKDFADIVGAYSQAFNKALYSRAFVKNMTIGKASDGRPLVAQAGMGSLLDASDTQPKATMMVNPFTKPEDFADYKPINHPAMRKWYWATKSENGENVFAKGDLVVHPEVAKHLQNILGSSTFRNNVVGKTVAAISNVIKQTIFSVSPFFHYVQEGTHALGHTINPGKVKNIDFNNPIHKKAIEHGLMLYDYNASNNFAEGLSSGNLFKKIPIFKSTVVPMQDFLFQNYIPRLKITTFEHALERNMERSKGGLANGSVTEDQIYEKTAKQMNAAYGHLNYDMMGRNKTTQDWFRQLSLAPDFLEARTRFVGQALTPRGAEQRRALIVLGGGMYLAARVMNKLLDDDYHFDKPFSVVYHGREYSLRSVPGDVYEMLHDFNRFMYNRIAPVSRIAMEGVTKYDVIKGKKIEYSDWLKDLATAPLPRAVTSNLPEDWQKFPSHDTTWNEKLWTDFVNTIGVKEKKFIPKAQGDAFERLSEIKTELEDVKKKLYKKNGTDTVLEKKYEDLMTEKEALNKIAYPDTSFRTPTPIERLKQSPIQKKK